MQMGFQGGCMWQNCADSCGKAGLQRALANTTLWEYLVGLALVLQDILQAHMAVRALM